MKALVTGATGFVGGRLVEALRADGVEVRCLVRDRGRAAHLEEAGCELHEGDVLDAETLRGAGAGADVAYYLIHSMGRGGDGDFSERERTSAANFARMAKADGVGRVIYLGGLGEPGSKHLRSRHETAQTLAEEGPPLTYFRAAMVVGAQSESFRTLYHLVKRLPVMIAPAWLRTKTQPIGIDDVIAYLSKAPGVPESEGREVEIGGPDVLSYGEMLGTVAEGLGKSPPPMLPVPLLTPGLSSLWIGLVTPVDTGVAKPLVEGLSTETIVEDPAGGALFDVEPQPFAESVRSALAEVEPQRGRGRVHVLERTQRLEVSAAQAFEFFADARNLEAITPGWLGFEVVTPDPIEMGPGTLIDYRLRLHRVPVRWRTRIEVWEPPARFVDVQLSGPYALWEHTHSFEPAGDDAVVIRDRVRYALPLGPLGALAHRAFVARDLERIFEHRRHAVARHLGADARA